MCGGMVSCYTLFSHFSPSLPSAAELGSQIVSIQIDFVVSEGIIN